jgi:hypothetical protein
LDPSMEIVKDETWRDKREIRIIVERKEELSYR